MYKTLPRPLLRMNECGKYIGLHEHGHYSYLTACSRPHKNKNLTIQSFNTIKTGQLALKKV